MLWLPVKQETLILPYSLPEAEARLQASLQKPDPDWGMPKLSAPQPVFTGWVKNRHFRISRSLHRPQNFSPLLIGSLEATQRGSIVFIRYSLFPTTLFYLLFWSVVALGLTVLFIAGNSNYWYATIAGSLAIAQYLIALQSFARQVKYSSTLLSSVFFQ